MHLNQMQVQMLMNQIHMQVHMHRLHGKQVQVHVHMPYLHVHLQIHVCTIMQPVFKTVILDQSLCQNDVLVVNESLAPFTSCATSGITIINYIDRMPCSDRMMKLKYAFKSAMNSRIKT